MSTRIPQSTLDAAAVNRPLRGRVAIAGAATYGSVSYTHLTLPTICSV